MYFSSFNIPFGIACILAIRATGHPLQNSDTGIEARLPGFGSKELGVETNFLSQDHSRKAGDLILEITFTNNYDQDIQLLEDKDSVLYSGGRVDVLSWSSSTIGVLPRFRGDSDADSEDAELELDTQSNTDPKKVHVTVNKGKTYTFQYHVGDSYDFRNVAAGHYTAQFRQTKFWISIDGKEVEAKMNLKKTIMPVEIEGQGNQESPESQLE